MPDTKEFIHTRVDTSQARNVREEVESLEEFSFTMVIRIQKARSHTQIYKRRGSQEECRIVKAFFSERI